MKKFFILVILLALTSPAFADGSPCEDTAYMIKRLEQEKQSARGTEAQNVKSLLAAAYGTYEANGCSKVQSK